MNLNIRLRSLFIPSIIVIQIILVSFVSLASAQTFSSTGKPGQNFATGTELLSGRILVAGGKDGTGNPTAKAELYDPSSGTFSSTGTMATARTGHTATLLSNGKVLIAGGTDANGSFTSTAEIYDPSTGTFSSTGSMSVARGSHTATLLTSGEVLIAGGFQEVNFVGSTSSSAELYDPTTGTFAVTGSMNEERESHTATILPSGKVLIAGGAGSNGSTTSATAELYDPSHGVFTYTGSMETARVFHTMTLLLDGRVLVAGGTISGTNTAEIYDPSSGVFGATGDMTVPRERHAATLLANGQVLISGGLEDANEHSSAELYAPSSGTFTATGDTINSQFAQISLLLNNGLVLVACGGGFDAELYKPASMPAVKIMSPVNNAVVQNTVTIFTAVSVQVRKSGWINLYIDGNYLNSSQPYNFSWNSTTVTNGTHTISVKAFIGSQQVASDSIRVDVENGASSGAVKITSPTSGAKVSGNVSIIAKVNRSVSWINIYIDGDYLASSPPDSFTWNSTKVTNGSHTISAQAFDRNGTQLGSDSVPITVVN